MATWEIAWGLIVGGGCCIALGLIDMSLFRGLAGTGLCLVGFMQLCGG